MTLNSPKISVILCTHNREEFLEKCLLSLENQQGCAGQYDVIIIDNASTDSTAEIAKRFTEKNINFKYHLENRLGLARARNTGLELTSAPLAAFTDDDAIPSENWVASMLERFSQLPSDVAVLGGEIDPIWESERPVWLTDSLLRPLSAWLGWDTVPRILRRDEWICEVNCCYRTEIIKKYGGFPETLGRKGDLLLSGENYVNEQIFSDGFRAFFDPSIRVSHFIPSNRLTVNWFLRRSFWQGVTASVCAEYDKQQGRKTEYWQSVKLPANVSDWSSILEAGESANSVEEGCGLISNIGYLLGVRGLVIGR